MRIRTRLHIELTELPYNPSTYKKTITDFGAEDINKMIISSGTVIRVSLSQGLEKSKYFKCASCGKMV